MAVDAHQRKEREALRRERSARGWSLDDVADHLVEASIRRGWSEPQPDSHAVGRWERGERAPRPRAVQLLCEVYSKTPAELGLGPDDEDVKRRTFLRGAGVGALGLLVGQVDGERLAEQVSYALRHPSRVDRECLQQLERTTILLQWHEGESRPEALIGSVAGHLAELLRLLKLGSLGTQTRARLWSLTGETAGAGGWLIWQSDDKEAAAAWFEFGLQAATEAGDHALGAYLVGCLSTQPTYRENPALRLQQLTGGSRGFHQLAAAPPTRAWLAVIEAEAHALLGRGRDAYQALDRARTIMSTDGDMARDSRPKVLSSLGPFFNHDYLTAEEGVVRAHLGEHSEAAGVLAPLLDSIAPGRRKNWYWLYPMLAGACIHLGDVERACGLAAGALQGSMKMGVATNLPLVSGVRRQLEVHRRDPAVQELDEAIRLARQEHEW
jgi:transcriptional regulator with XRE-family HTH domain